MRTIGVMFRVDPITGTRTVVSDFGDPSKGPLGRAPIRVAVVKMPPLVAGATPVGTNVNVQPVDSTTGTSPVTMTFSNVTQAGTTSLTTSGVGAPPPTGFKLGNPPTYYNIGTTAVFSGPITICINYSGISFGDASKLRLFHNEN